MGIDLFRSVSRMGPMPFRGMPRMPRPGRLTPLPGRAPDPAGVFDPAPGYRDVPDETTPGSGGKSTLSSPEAHDRRRNARPGEPTPQMSSEETSRAFFSMNSRRGSPPAPLRFVQNFSRSVLSPHF